jgi:putative Holliday junction resolvase
MPAVSRDSALVFDFGERRIGVASANRLGDTASPLKTLAARAGEPDWRAIDALVREWQPHVLVVGLPLNVDGSESAMTARTREFIRALGQRCGIPVETVDERYTSAEAGALLREQRRAGTMQRRVRPGDLDSMAAVLMAESWLRLG